MKIHAYLGFLGLLIASLDTPDASALTAVSDIDDTLKISHVLDPIDAMVRGLSSKEAFNGMSEALNALPAGTRFIYLSGRNHLLSQNTLNFLNENHFPSGDLITHRSSDPDSLQEYKASKIREILASQSDELILMGDDTQSDPEAFDEVIRQAPLRIKGAYIHQITGRPLPSSVTPILTAFDLAEQWYARNDLNYDQLRAVAKATLAPSHFSASIARFQICPIEYQAPIQAPELINLNHEIENRIVSECSKSPEERESD